MCPSALKRDWVRCRGLTAVAPAPSHRPSVVPTSVSSVWPSDTSVARVRIGGREDPMLTPQHRHGAPCRPLHTSRTPVRSVRSVCDPSRGNWPPRAMVGGLNYLSARAPAVASVVRSCVRARAARARGPSYVPKRR
eukprot:6191928-Pleurochrysis_carterae.AAC.1